MIQQLVFMCKNVLNVYFSFTRMSSNMSTREITVVPRRTKMQNCRIVEEEFKVSMTTLTNMATPSGVGMIYIEEEAKMEAEMVVFCAAVIVTV